MPLVLPVLTYHPDECFLSSSRDPTLAPLSEVLTLPCAHRSPHLSLLIQPPSGTETPGQKCTLYCPPKEQQQWTEWHDFDTSLPGYLLKSLDSTRVEPNHWLNHVPWDQGSFFVSTSCYLISTCFQSIMKPDITDQHNPKVVVLLQWPRLRNMRSNLLGPHSQSTPSCSANYRLTTSSTLSSPSPSSSSVFFFFFLETPLSVSPLLCYRVLGTVSTDIGSIHIRVCGTEGHPHLHWKQ